MEQAILGRELAGSMATKTYITEGLYLKAFRIRGQVYAPVAVLDAPMDTARRGTNASSQAQVCRGNGDSCIEG